MLVTGSSAGGLSNRTGRLSSKTYRGTHRMQPHYPLMGTAISATWLIASVHCVTGAAAWWHDAPRGRWALAAQLPGPPADAVAWAPVLGRPSELFAVASGPDITVWSLTGHVDALEVGVMCASGHRCGFSLPQSNRLPHLLPALSHVAHLASCRYSTLKLGDARCCRRKKRQSCQQRRRCTSWSSTDWEAGWRRPMLLGRCSCGGQRSMAHGIC